jgi:hypothetical protein
VRKSQRCNSGASRGKGAAGQRDSGAPAGAAAGPAAGAAWQWGSGTEQHDNEG